MPAGNKGYGKKSGAQLGKTGPAKPHSSKKSSVDQDAKGQKKGQFSVG
jgi:hypothetical protein